MIFTEKSAYQSENRVLWKITKNVTTHHQIIRFDSFLDILVLTTSWIGFSSKFFTFSFLVKNHRFSDKIGQNHFFLAENRLFFAEKWKYQNFGTKTYSTGCKDQHIQKWAKSDYLVMSCYVFRDFSQIAIFSIGCWFFSENPSYFTEFSLFCISAYYFQKYSLNLCFGPIYSLFEPSLGGLVPFFSPHKCHFLVIFA